MLRRPLPLPVTKRVFFFLAPAATIWASRCSVGSLAQLSAAAQDWRRWPPSSAPTPVVLKELIISPAESTNNPRDPTPHFFIVQKQGEESVVVKEFGAADPIATISAESNSDEGARFEITSTLVQRCMLQSRDAPLAILVADSSSQAAAEALTRIVSDRGLPAFSAPLLPLSALQRCFSPQHRSAVFLDVSLSWAADSSAVTVQLRPCGCPELSASCRFDEPHPLQIAEFVLSAANSTRFGVEHVALVGGHKFVREIVEAGSFSSRPRLHHIFPPPRETATATDGQNVLQFLLGRSIQQQQASSSLSSSQETKETRPKEEEEQKIAPSSSSSSSPELTQYLSQIYSTQQRNQLSISAQKRILSNFVVMVFRPTLHTAFTRRGNTTSESNCVEFISFLDHSGKHFLPPLSGYGRRGQARVPNLDGYDTLVIHGAKEALLLLADDAELRRFLKRGGRVWCTAVAEYALAGFRASSFSVHPHHRHISSPAERVALSYFGGGAVFDAPESTVAPPCSALAISDQKHAVCARSAAQLLCRIFREQVDRAGHSRQAQLLSLLGRMDFVLFISQVERSGIFVDQAHPVVAGLLSKRNNGGRSPPVSQQKQQQQHNPDALLTLCLAAQRMMVLKNYDSVLAQLSQTPVNHFALSRSHTRRLESVLDILEEDDVQFHSAENKKLRAKKKISSRAQGGMSSTIEFAVILFEYSASGITFLEPVSKQRFDFSTASGNKTMMMTSLKKFLHIHEFMNRKRRVFLVARDKAARSLLEAQFSESYPLCEGGKVMLVNAAELISSSSSSSSSLEQLWKDLSKASSSSSNSKYPLDRVLTLIVQKSLSHSSSSGSSTATKRPSSSISVKQLEAETQAIQSFLAPDQLLIHPGDGCIRQEIRVCETATGRTSARLPNCQGLPKADDSSSSSALRRILVSRHVNGWMVEVDFKQLEVAVLGLLSQDPGMVRDLAEGVDFHLKRCAAAFFPDYSFEEVLACYSGAKQQQSDKKKKKKKKQQPLTFSNVKEMRTRAKIVSFQRMYGAGQQALAKSSGLSIHAVSTLTAIEARNYPVAENFSRFSQELCLLGRKENSTSSHLIHELPTGARVAIPRQDVEVLAPTVKNYPVQSYAAELVSLLLGKLYREMLARDEFCSGKAAVVNFVHDSVWLDCQDSVVKEVVSLVQATMSSLQDQLTRDFPGAPNNVGLKVSVSIGRNMAVTEDYDAWLCKK